MFYRERFLAPRPTPKLEDHPSSAVHDSLFNIFAATLHIGGRSSIRNLRMRHAVVTRTHYIKRYSPTSDNRGPKDALFPYFISVNNSANFGQTYCPKLEELFTEIKLRNSASWWLLL